MTRGTRWPSSPPAGRRPESESSRPTAWPPASSSRRTPGTWWGLAGTHPGLGPGRRGRQGPGRPAPGGHGRRVLSGRQDAGPGRARGLSPCFPSGDWKALPQSADMPSAVSWLRVTDDGQRVLGYTAAGVVRWPAGGGPAARVGDSGTRLTGEVAEHGKPGRVGRRPGGRRRRPRSRARARNADVSPVGHRPGRRAGPLDPR